MKRIYLLLLTFSFFVLGANAQISTCVRFDGFWSDWEKESTTKIHGNYDGFMLYKQEDGPWGSYFKFTINNFNIAPKKQRKKDVNENKWYEYSGTVEYYVPIMDNGTPATIYNMFQYAKKAMFWPKERKEESDPQIKKVVSNATIRISAYKDHPKCYNIIFDNVGFAIDLGTTYFPKSTFNFDK